MKIYEALQELDKEVVLLPGDVRESYREDEAAPGPLQGWRCPSAGATEAEEGEGGSGQLAPWAGGAQVTW